MKMKAVAASALLAMLFITPAYGQPATANDPHHRAGAGATSAPGEGATPDSNAGAEPMSDMCGSMMGHGMGMGMRMGGAAPSDAQGTAAMLEMRGEMMKAMGDVMMKHARRMRGMSSK